MQYMGGRQLRKWVDTLDHIKQRNDESLGDIYTQFNKELVRIDQVITGGETIHAFVKDLGAKHSIQYDSQSVIPINTLEDMTVKVESYIDLEIVKKGKKTHK